MSISNTNRTSPYVPMPGDQTLVVYKQTARPVNDVQPKQQHKREEVRQPQWTQKSTSNTPPPFYINIAQEMYHKMSGGFNDGRSLTFERLNPNSFSSTFSSTEQEYPQVEVKRHQQYFNQMMNYDNPLGRWVDVQA